MRERLGNRSTRCFKSKNGANAGRPACTGDERAASGRRRRNCNPGQLLALRRQPENRYDALAIEVLGPEGHKLGYVPRQRNEMPARLIDAGKRLSARTESIVQRRSWLNIQISLYLDDA